MIFVTGDVHGLEGFARLRDKKLQKLTASDYLVICGDAGLCWLPTREQAPELWTKREKELQGYWDEEQRNLQWLSEQPWTTLFVDGNHENFTRLYQYPVREFCGGKAGQLAEKVWHLRRGEVYQVDGKKIFAMGGATSVDRYRRKAGISWWPEEVPNDEEWANAEANLERHRWRVEYVFTHCPPESIRRYVPSERHCEKPRDVVTEGLERIRERLKYKNWYFGHHHVNIPLERKFWALYEDFVVAGGPQTERGQLNYQMTEAARLGWYDAVAKLLKKGAQIARVPAELKRDVCTQMLLYVARRGFLTHRLKPAPLIKMGADVHATDDDGNSALLIAAEHNMTAAAMVLMRSGAAPDQRVLAALEERVRDAEIEAKHFSGICLVKERLQEARRALRMCRERMP